MCSDIVLIHSELSVLPSNFIIKTYIQFTGAAMKKKKRYLRSGE